MSNGLLLLIGTSKLYLFADFVIVYNLTVGRIFAPKAVIHPSRTYFALVGLLALSSILSPITLAQSWQTVLRLLALGYLLPNYRINFSGRDTKIVLAILIGVGIWQLVFVTNRASGYHMNPTIFGMLGMALAVSGTWPLAILGSTFLSMSIARVPLLILWMYAAITHTKSILVVLSVTLLLFGVISLIKTPDRITYSGIRTAIFTRLEATMGFQDSTLDKIYNDGRCGERRPIEVRWQGYGFGGYCHQTGQPTPHNAYKLSLYELGILAVPFWLLILALVVKLHWRIWVPLAALALVTDDLYFTPEGIYIIAIWLLATKALRQPTAEPVET